MDCTCVVVRAVYNTGHIDPFTHTSQPFTDGAATTGRLGFSIVHKNARACGLEEPGI